MEGDEFMASVAISTLGCKVNAYESESTAQALRQRGYQTVDFKEKADVYIIFTCAVTNTAASKSRQKIHRPQAEPGRPGVRCGLLRPDSGGTDV